MTRKPRKPLRALGSSELPPRILQPRFRAPREVRVVSAARRRERDPATKSKRTRGRLVPRITLSGAWLERIGFTRGTRFLVLADVHNQILLALVDL